jgi:hypothetical protein
MKRKVESLFDEIHKSFDTNEARVFLEKAKNRSMKIFVALLLPTIPTVLTGNINHIFTVKTNMPVYKPEAWKNDTGIIFYCYWLVQCGTIFYNIALLVTFNTFLTCLLIYFQEYAKFLGEKFATMRSVDDLKNCVEKHSNFKRQVQLQTLQFILTC